MRPWKRKRVRRRRGGEGKVTREMSGRRIQEEGGRMVDGECCQHVAPALSHGWSSDPIIS